MRRVTRIISYIGCLVVMSIAWFYWQGRANNVGADHAGHAFPVGSIALAVIGDSDSHSYHDRIAFPAGGSKRGGVYQTTTFQWTEVLARLRGKRLDQGAWGVYGASGIFARTRQKLGLGGRLPRKQDYRYNFAVSGAECGDLLEGSSRQVISLIELMDSEPARWRDGVVVIRIGVNSFGGAESLHKLAMDAGDPEVQEVITNCVQVLEDSVIAVHARHPGVRFVLIGIFNNVHWPNYLDRWHDPVQLRNISIGLDAFDHALRAMARADPRIIFFDDRAWFAARWGSRNAKGNPAYREVAVGEMRVSNSAGDAPNNSVLADGHAGVVWNVLWGQSLVDLLNVHFGLQLDPITEDEMLAFLAHNKPPASAQKLDNPVASVNR